MTQIVNYFRQNCTNIGDKLSSPLLYFKFDGVNVRTVDILDKVSVPDADLVIFGGGGLLEHHFATNIHAKSCATRPGTAVVAWGLGQQLDRGDWWSKFRQFPYEEYLRGFSLVGIRDFDLGYPWVPCASCMHPSFDKVRSVEHEFVVYSHAKHQIPIERFPTLANDAADFEEVLNFLGSGETVLTSSYHGMYWALLLGRRVVAFPFNSKFFTLKYPVTLYPAVWSKRSALNSLMSSKGRRDSKVCGTVDGWRRLAGSARSSTEALEECRASNIGFHRQVLASIP